MPGMTGVNPALENAFRTALLNQGTFALLIFVLLAITWIASRELLPGSVKAALAMRRSAGYTQPLARTVLRVGIGVLWIFDGLLQAQPGMPAGLPSQVIAPAAASSPGWVRHVVAWGGTAWSSHPVDAAAGAVWIQLGIGVWLVASGGGRWSRLAALASGLWGLVVWVFGEAFGGIFGPGLSWLTGAPGGVLFYCAAAALLMLPDRAWRTATLGRRVLAACGAALIGFAVLQAWPGRGFWQGSSHGRPGSLHDSINSMAAMRQPAPLASLVRGFGSLVIRHGMPINLICVILLAATGAAMLSGRLTFVRPAVIVAIVFCLGDWVLVQDFGVFGGLGTDPNSMIPQALLLTCGLLAMTHLPADQAPAPGPSIAEAATPAALPSAVSHPIAADSAARSLVALTPDARTPASPSGIEPDPVAQTPVPMKAGSLARGVSRAFGCASASAVIAAWGAALMIMGTAPMALAAVNRHPGSATARPREASSQAAIAQRRAESRLPALLRADGSYGRGFGPVEGG